MCDWERRQARVIAEFSAWPVGWLLVLDKEPFEGALDVTSWLSFGYDERVPLEIDLPCQWAAMEYPADFRDPRQVKTVR